MNKIVVVLGVLALVGVGVYAYYKKQIGVLYNYTYKIIFVKIKKITKQELSFDIKTRFSNASKIEATVNKIWVEIFVEGVKSGQIVENKAFVLPAKGSSDIDLFVSVNPQAIFKNIVQIFLTGAKQRDIKFQMKGYANVSSGIISTTIPIDFSDTLKSYF